MEYAYTPKEKAIQLVGKFIDQVSWGRLEHKYQCDENAKQCVLISVDETLEALNENQWQNRNQIAYYKEVKQEMQKL
jgi:hypothetical protein